MGIIDLESRQLRTNLGHLTPNGSVWPTGEKVLIHPIDPPDKTISGLHIARSRRIDPTPNQAEKGIVVAVGPGANGWPPDGSTTSKLWHTFMRMKQIRKGDTVWWAAWQGTNVKFDGELFIVLDIQEILLCEPLK